tara:strand:- start:1025 stop:1924 length:900 start_codon:yes stop_codon:yes gene_type:complete
VELQDRLEELQSAGIGVAAISYDSQKTLSNFAERYEISFPLLSDNNSAVISEFGILNTIVQESLGPRAKDPDVTEDVYRFVAAEVMDSQFPQLRRMINGTPFPGTFMLDANGVVASRYFEEFYRERMTTSNVMLKEGIALNPIAAIEGSSAQLNFRAYPSNPVVTNGSRFSIAVDVKPNENMHVYGPGAENMGYQVIKLNMAPSEYVSFESMEYPESEIYHFKPLDEHVPVYQLPFTILQEAVVAASAEKEEQLREINALTLSGELEYQACDDAICYLPVSVPVTFTLEFDHLDYQRAR